MKTVNTIFWRILGFIPFASIAFLGFLKQFFGFLWAYCKHGGEAVAYLQPSKRIADVYGLVAEHFEVPELSDEQTEEMLRPIFEEEERNRGGDFDCEMPPSGGYNCEQ